ncbi:hypothetical protein BC628DRAFT_689618 [Trametes gibbosa]|nr:hypothetical protein BC628DRAFT_689618 [Trametes gibbosa]
MALAFRSPDERAPAKLIGPAPPSPMYADCTTYKPCSPSTQDFSGSPCGKHGAPDADHFRSDGAPLSRTRLMIIRNRRPLTGSARRPHGSRQCQHHHVTALHVCARPPHMNTELSSSRRGLHSPCPKRLYRNRTDKSFCQAIGDLSNELCCVWRYPSPAALIHDIYGHHAGGFGRQAEQFQGNPSCRC